MAVMKTAVRRTSALLDALEESPGSYSQRLTEFATGQLDNILAHKLSTQLVLRETLTEGSEHGEEIARLVMGEVYNRLVEMVRQGQQKAEFREDIDPTLAAFMIVAANMFFFQSAPVMAHLPEIGFTGEAKSFSQETMDLLINGMRRKGDD
jgi:TetR/AcrR family transcriptional regulator